MALNFQPPPQQQKKSKTESFLEPITQGLNSLPALMLQYEQLKRQRELDALAHREAVSKFGSGAPAPVNTDYTTSPTAPGSTLSPLSSPLNPQASGTTTDVQETPEQLMARIGTEGLKAKADLMKAQNDVTVQPKREKLVRLEKGKLIDAATNQPITEQEQGVDYTFINPGEDAAKNRAGNLDLRGDSQVYDLHNRMINDPRIKPLHNQNINARFVDKIIERAKSGNTVASAALGAKMARTMGEVGVLTDTDLERYVVSGRLDRKAADKLSKWINGKPTDATLDEIQQIASILRDSYSEFAIPVYQEYVDLLANNKNIDEKEAARLLTVDKYLYLTDNPSPSASPGQPQAGPKPPTATSSQPVQITGDDDYNKLPSGTRFVGPDGKVRVKP